MVRTLLSTTMCGAKGHCQPTDWGAFSLSWMRRAKQRRTVGYSKCVEVHHCPSLVSIVLVDFRYHKNEISFRPLFHWTNPADIPRIAAALPRRGRSQGRLRRREAVKTLDTALSASAHNPNIRGMSVFPLAEGFKFRPNRSQLVRQVQADEQPRSQQEAVEECVDMGGHRPQVTRQCKSRLPHCLYCL
jgi:hypothetical protein